MYETIEYYHYTKNKLKQWGYTFSQSIPSNNGRYEILIGSERWKDVNIMLIYKQEWFLKYGEMLKDKGARGIGESVNKIQVLQALMRNVTFIFRVTKDRKIYYISLYDFINNAIEWKNELLPNKSS